VALTGRAALAALLAAVLIGVHPGWPTFAAVNAGVLLLITVDVASAGAVRALRIRREGATAVRQGEEATVTLVVANEGRRAVRAQIRDAWPPSAGSSPRVHAVHIPPAEQRRCPTVLRPTRRGDREAARITVRSVGPLGLAARQSRHVAPWTVRVVPPFTSRRFLPERLARLRTVEGRVAARGAGQGSELDSLRAYVPGDDVRSIDWRATARRETVAVRTYRPERDRRVVICLDTGRTAAARIVDAPRLDHALDASLLLAAIAERAGDRVDLLAYDAIVRADVRSGSRGPTLPRLNEAMALLEPQLVEADPSVLVPVLLGRARRRSLVVFLTDLNAAALEEGLLPLLPALTARHTVVLASVADPEIDAMARSRGDARAVYDAAAAERARTERRRVATDLRQRGVEVVDATADTFAPAVADAYLALKSAGRL
jgi:uncharacterized protein (DUF58 family)